jgi:hypothetical protein
VADETGWIKQSRRKGGVEEGADGWGRGKSSAGANADGWSGGRET